MTVEVIGLDTAKHVFQVHGADASGRTVLRKRLRRAQIPDFFGNLPRCVVGIEATQGAHYWARVIGAFGHTIRLIAPQFVKPYLRGQKNDARDAAAICEAISRPRCGLSHKNPSANKICKRSIASEAGSSAAARNLATRFADCWLSTALCFPSTLIEDNPADIQLLRYAFDQLREPYELTVLEDGEEALHFVRDVHHGGGHPLPCVIVLDLGLPKYDGMTVLRAIKSEPILKRYQDCHFDPRIQSENRGPSFGGRRSDVSNKT